MINAFQSNSYSPNKENEQYSAGSSKTKSASTITAAEAAGAHSTSVSILQTFDIWASGNTVHTHNRRDRLFRKFHYWRNEYVEKSNIFNKKDKELVQLQQNPPTTLEGRLEHEKEIRAATTGREEAARNMVNPAIELIKLTNPEKRTEYYNDGVISKVDMEEFKITHSIAEVIPNFYIQIESQTSLDLIQNGQNQGYIVAYNDWIQSRQKYSEFLSGIDYLNATEEKKSLFLKDLKEQKKNIDTSLEKLIECSDLATLKIDIDLLATREGQNTTYEAINSQVKTSIAVSQYSNPIFATNVIGNTYKLATHLIPQNIQETTAFQVTHSIIQILLEPAIRDGWLSQIYPTDYPEELRNSMLAQEDAFSDNMSEILGIVSVASQFFPKETQKWLIPPLRNTQNVFSVINAISTIYSKGLSTGPLLSLTTALSSLILVGHSCLSNEPPSRTLLAVHDAFQSLSPFQTAYNIFQDGGKWTSLMSSVGVDISGIISSPIFITAGTIALIAIPTFIMIRSYGLSQTIYAVQDAEDLRSKGSVKHAKSYMKEVKGWWTSRNDLVDSYLSSVDALQTIPTLSRGQSIQLNALVPKISDTVSKFKEIGNSSIPLRLQLAQLEGYLNTEEYKLAKDLLSDPDTKPYLPAIIPYFVRHLLVQSENIREETSSANPSNKAIKYLNKMFATFPLQLAEHRDLICAYGTCIGSLNRLPTLTAAQIIELNACIIKIDRALVEFKKHEGFSYFIARLQCTKLQGYLNTRDARIKDLLSQNDIDPQTIPMFVTYLLEQADALCKQAPTIDRFGPAIAYLNQIYESFPEQQVRFVELMEEYGKHIIAREGPNEVEHREHRLQSIKAVLEKIDSKDNFQKLIFKLQKQKMLECINANNCSEISTMLSEEEPDSLLHAYFENHLIDQTEALAAQDLPQPAPQSFIQSWELHKEKHKADYSLRREQHEQEMASYNFFARLCMGNMPPPLDQTDDIFQQIPLLERYNDYLFLHESKIKKFTTPDIRISSIDAILDGIKSKNHFQPLNYRLLSEKLSEFLNENKYAEINEILEREKDSKIHACLADHLIDKATDPNQQDSEAFLTNALNLLPHLQYRDLIEKYSNYLISIKNINITPELEIQKIDEILNLTASSAKFIHVYLRLLHKKLTKCLDNNKYETAKNILDQDEYFSTIQILAVAHLIEKAETLCEQQKYIPAKEYLRVKRGALGNSFIHNNLIEKYENYISCRGNVNATPENRIQTIDEVLKQMSPTETFSRMRLKYQCEKIVLCLDDNKYDLTKAILDQKGNHTQIHSLLAVHLINKADILCSQDLYNQAKDYLTAQRIALGQSLMHANFIEKYENYISSRGNKNATEEQRVQTINEVLELAENEEDYLHIRLQLRSEKLVLLTNTNYFLAIDDLKRDDTQPKIHALFATRLIEEGERLCAQGQYTSAKNYLKTKRVDLKLHLKHKDLIEKYENHIAHRENANATNVERIQTIDDILGLMQPQEDFPQLSFQLQYEKIILFVDDVDKDKYEQARAALDQADNHPKIHALLASHLIHKADALCSQRHHRAAKDLLADNRNALQESLKHKILIEKYEDYITCLENANSPHIEQIQRIDDVLQQVAPVEDFPQLYIKLQREKLVNYLEINNFVEANEILRKEKKNSKIHALIAEYLIAKAERENQQNPVEFLKNISNQLDQLQYAALLDSYSDYISRRSKINELPERILTINSVLDKIQSIRDLPLTYFTLQCDKLSILVEMNSHDQVENVFSQMDNNSMMRKSINKWFTLYLINKAEEFCAKNQYILASNLLTSMSNAFNATPNLQKLIEKYEKFIFSRGKLNATNIERLQTIDDVLLHAQPNEDFLQIRLNVQYEKVTLHVDMNEHPQAMVVLNKEDNNSKLHTMLARHLIEKADVLCDQNQYIAARKYLISKRNSLGESLVCKTVIEKYENYISCLGNPKTKPQELIQTIDEVLEQMQPKDDFPQAHLNLQYKKLTMCLDVNNIDKLKTVLNQIGNHPQRDHFLANFLIHKADTLLRQGQSESASRYLFDMRKALNEDLRYQNLIEKYEDYISCPMNISDIERILKSNNVLDRAEPKHAFKLVRSKIQLEKLIFYINKNEIHKARDVLIQENDDVKLHSLLVSFLIEETNNLYQQGRDCGNYLSTKSDELNLTHHRSLIREYTAYILCCKNKNATPIQRIQSIDAVLNLITKSDFLKLHTRLQREKLFACLDANNTVEMSKILREQGSDSKIHAHLANYWINQIDNVEKGHELQMIESIPRLTSFEYFDIPAKYYLYFLSNTDSPLEARLLMIGFLMEDLPKVDFPQVHLRLQYKKLTLCVDAQRPDLAKSILNQESDYSEIHEKFASYLIQKAEILCGQSQYSIARQSLKTQRTVLGAALKHEVLIKKYEDYISYLENTRPSKKEESSSSISPVYSNNEHEINKAIEIINNLIFELKKLNYPITKFEKENAGLYYLIAKINIRKGNSIAAEQAARKGQELLPHTEKNKYNEIHIVIQRMRRQ